MSNEYILDPSSKPAVRHERLYQFRYVLTSTIRLGIGHGRAADLIMADGFF